MAPITVLDSETDPVFESRWAAWQQRGIAQDRTHRRRLRTLLPVFLVVVAAAGYLLLLR